jgi:hypothetical protein
LEVPRALDHLLAQETLRLGLASSLRVMAFVLFGPPRGRLHLFWLRLADLDTPAQNHRIESLAKALRERLSEQCRVGTGAFARRITRISMISDSEMRRINLEFSANLSRLMRLLHEDERGCLRLLHLACEHLAMPRLRPGRCAELLDALRCSPKFGQAYKV